MLEIWSTSKYAQCSMKWKECVLAECRAFTARGPWPIYWTTLGVLHSLQGFQFPTNFGRGLGGSARQQRGWEPGEPCRGWEAQTRPSTPPRILHLSQLSTTLQIPDGKRPLKSNKSTTRATGIGPGATITSLLLLTANLWIKHIIMLTRTVAPMAGRR